jgi:hypothetical protein
MNCKGNRHSILGACLGSVFSTAAAVTRPLQRWPRARLESESRLQLYVPTAPTEIVRPPRDQCGLSCGAGRLSIPIAINRDRFRCIEPGIRGDFLQALSPLEDVQNGCAARCGRDLHKSAKVPCGKAHSSTPPLCKAQHLRFTSEIARGMRSQTQRRGSCDGRCKRRIDDVARRGIRRHLWWCASAS